MSDLNRQLFEATVASFHKLPRKLDFRQPSNFLRLGRAKRGLFDYGGNALSIIFGLSTEAELGQLKSLFSNETLALRISNVKLGLEIKSLQENTEIIK